MYLRHRHRRGLYPVAAESPFPRILKSLIKLAVTLLILYWVGSWLLGLLGFGNVVQRDPATLLTEGRGLVSVSLQGEQEQTAETGMNMFAGDTLSTGPAANASLKFFDGTWVRLEETSNLTIDESANGRKESTIALKLSEGTLWVRTPDAEASSGTTIHTVTTPTLRFTLTAGTEAVISDSSILVYAADGLGVEVAPQKGSSFTISEGQKWTAPEDGDPGPNPLAARSALSVGELELPFTLQSRQRAQVQIGQTGNTSPDILTLTAPAPNAILRQPTLMVRGTVASSVAKVLVNGHEAIIDQATRTFAQEVAPPSGADSFELQVKAVDATGTTLDSIARTIPVEVETVTPGMGSPTITGPAATGETFTTNAAEIIVRGTAPAGTAGIMVNEYKLQLFSPEKGTWSYLASKALGNLKDGTNVYDVYALDASGAKSPPARITVVVGAATGTQASAGTVSSVAPVQNNAPLTPGVLTVTGPTPGTTHAETGTGFLLEGKTSPQTATMWVNDYRLQLYLPGKTTWNYIADTKYKNLVPGKNVYTIVARNEKGEVLDRMEYTVTLGAGE